VEEIKEDPASTNKAIFDDTSFDADWAAEIEEAENYVDKKQKRANLSAMMKVSIGDMLEKGTEVSTQGPIDPFFEEQPIHAGDQFMACKPWTGAIKKPTEDSGPLKNNPGYPEETFGFDFVHGYNSYEVF
jgi:hypothetical protein